MAIKGEKVHIHKRLEDNTQWLDRELGVEQSFDMLRRDFTFAGKNATLYFIDAFAKDQTIILLMRYLALIKREEIAVHTYEKIINTYLSYSEINLTDDLHQVTDHVLAGPVALLIDGFDQAIIIDARVYPARSPEEPDLERVVRGSRDGFVETVVYNAELIRRRIRDPKLRMEALQAGSRSKTDIIVAYIEDIANPELVQNIKDRIEAIKIDGLPMAEKSVEELISPGSRWNPFPRVRYTERPDVAAVHLLEGHVLIIVDTSPSVIILPATYFHHLQHAEEFRQNPAVGGFVRWVRFLGVFNSTLLVPLWLLFAIVPALLPKSLSFIGPQKTGHIPLVWQALITEFGLTSMRMAAIHTPTSLATALGLIAAVLIGQIAIEVGLLAPEIILYMAIAAVGTFSTPSYELGLANNLARIFLVIAAGFFRLPGLIFAAVLLFVLLAYTKSFGVPYLWPLFPFNWPALKTVLVRSPISLQKFRPSILRPQDPDRMPAPAFKPVVGQKRRRKHEEDEEDY